MRVLLQSLIREIEPGRVRLTIQFGAERPKSFSAHYEEKAGKVQTCVFEEELFLRLSDLAAERFCNSAIYSSELMGIIKAFLSHGTLPPFPVELGTTGFGLTRPSRVKVFLGRLRRPWVRAWRGWSVRHVRPSEKCG